MVLRAEAINKKFTRKTADGNDFYAVKTLDFALRPGQVTTIMGRSGSGKSTLLNMLAGLLKPTQGNVYLGDTELYSMTDAKLSVFRNKYIGVIPQGQTFLSSLTVLENVKLPYLMYEKSDNITERAKELLDMVGILNLKDSYPNELSGGENRRLSIARALIQKPAVLLADEPTGDLDDENTGVVLRLLRETARQGTAVLLVTHEQEAIVYSDNIYKMNAGVLTSTTSDFIHIS